MITPIFIDLETTADGGPKGDSPEAHWRNNKVLLAGASSSYTSPSGAYQVNVWDNVKDLLTKVALRSLRDGCPEILLVGHNIKFDLKYLLRDVSPYDWSRVRIWDTMTFEYLESGHVDQFMSLEAACAKRGVPFTKGLDLGALLGMGVKMQDIDKDSLITYLEKDVEAVAALYFAQVATGYVPDMDYILPLADMELNGLPLNVPKAQALMGTLISEVAAAEGFMEGYISMTCEWDDGTPIIDEDFTDQIGIKSKYIKAMAPRTTSMLLTGVPNIIQVTPKWKLRRKHGYGTPLGIPQCLIKVTPTNLGYPMDNQILEEIGGGIPSAVLKYRQANKLLSTYVSPFLEVGMLQGHIYPKLNTTATATGRLSSSAPNGQNVPPTARDLIEPGFAYGQRELLEIDFKQLELVSSACVTGCSGLQRAISSGEDIHYTSGKSVFGWKSPDDMTKEQRTVVKNVNFGVIYGGKAKGLSRQTGVDTNVIQNLIDSFYTKYPGVARWQRNLYTEIVSKMEPDKIIQGQQVYKSKYTEPFSGRRFTFKETKSPDWLARKLGRPYSFSPNQVFNYPIQGVAGGDIVMSCLTELWRDTQRKWPDIIHRMTVHDSILLDVPAGLDLQPYMERACRKTEKKLNLPVKLSYDIKRGSTWQ